MSPISTTRIRYDVDVDCFDAIVAFLDRHPDVKEGVVAITGLFDEKFPLIERIAHRYGWRCPGPVICRLSDKAVVQALVGDFSPRSLVFTKEDVETLDLERLAGFGGELVLKPTVASGGVGVIPVLNDVCLRDRLLDVMPHAMMASPDSPRWMLQQRISGRLISCEGYVKDHVAHYLGLSERACIGLTEVSNRFPADRRWVRAVDDCRACVDALIDRSGHDNSYFHCEFLATDERAYLIDANIGRIGGASILEQIAIAHDCAPEVVLRHVLLLPLGDLGEVTVPPYRALEVCNDTLGIWYGIPMATTIERVQPPSHARIRHTQFAVEGRHVHRVGTSDYAWVGMMSGGCGDVNDAIGEVRIVTDAGACLPAFVVA